MKFCTVLAGFNEFGFNESSRFFDLKYFFCFTLKITKHKLSPTDLALAKLRILLY